MTASSNPLIAFENLSGGYGDTQVVRDIEGMVHPGEVLGIIGRNGVGKTTLIRLLTGEIRASAGKLWLRGERVDDWPTHRRQRAGLACMPQERLVFNGLSVRENLTLHRSDRSLDACEPLLMQFPRLRERLALPAGRLSGGEKKLVAFARTLIDGAPLTLLDEPSEGVQQENIERMAEVIDARRRAGGAFVIVEQNLSFVLPLVDTVLVLDHGRIVRSGSAGPQDRDGLMQHLLV